MAKLPKIYKQVVIHTFMILELLFLIIFGILSVVGIFLPGYGEVPLKLPWGVDQYVETASGWVHSFVGYVWPAEVILTVALIYLGFRLGMVFLKLFLGSRTPNAN